jgi:mRNA interferase YafQ
MKVTQTTQFQKDAKRLGKRGKDLSKLRGVVDLLLSGSVLPDRLRDHPLSGDWKGWRDCHIEPDWLLIYKLLSEELILGRTGSHSDLF